MSRTRTALVPALVVTAQLACLLVAVAPQLSARATGEEYRLKAQLDETFPSNPLRGDYVELVYPELDQRRSRRSGTVYLPLRKDGNGWSADETVATRPEEGPYLTCEYRSSTRYCGIDTWFVHEGEADRLVQSAGLRPGIATVRIDSRGNASVVDVQP